MLTIHRDALIISFFPRNYLTVFAGTLYMTEKFMNKVRLPGLVGVIQ